MSLFQKDGPFNKQLAEILEAYAAFNPTLGYAQGFIFFSFILFYFILYFFLFFCFLFCFLFYFLFVFLFFILFLFFIKEWLFWLEWCCYTWTLLILLSAFVIYWIITFLYHLGLSTLETLFFKFLFYFLIIYFYFYFIYF